MSKIDVINTQGNIVGEAELSESVFAIEISEHAVYETVKNHLANRRQGTQSAKTRAEVRGGGRKPWRQKGTGRARAGSNRSPLWTGGGIIFAPKPRDYSYTIPKKTKRKAIKSALTYKFENEELIVLDELKFDEISTKNAAQIISTLAANKKKVLLAVAEKDEVIYKSFRNLSNVNVVVANLLNVYDVVNSDVLILTKDAVKLVEEVFN